MQKAPDDAAVPQKPHKDPLFKFNLKGFKERGGCGLKAVISPARSGEDRKMTLMTGVCRLPVVTVVYGVLAVAARLLYSNTLLLMQRWLDDEF